MPRNIYIGELSRRTGRSIHTIRWYESQALIPGVRRDAWRPIARRGMHRDIVAAWLAGWEGPILIDAHDVNLTATVTWRWSLRSAVNEAELSKSWCRFRTIL